ncbi:hypothetical protein GBAR_LOCUS16574 [Geodia barretti]|uniref:Uncharacterized protein n=1 Tax=Geodia barretti TaxID=519541 RepID=A0AA35SID2_GEOBA|nr:hypothetical protein GBAR_LOCUS16574 [Geodia barretti]
MAFRSLRRASRLINSSRGVQAAARQQVRCLKVTCQWMTSSADSLQNR